MSRPTDRSKWCLLVVFVLLPLLSPGILGAQDRGDAGPEGAVLAGKVVAGRDRAPVEGALAIIEELEIGTRTDEQGRFAFTDLPSGSYHLKIRRLGRSSKTVQIHLHPGERLVTDLRLKDRARDPVRVPGLEVVARRRIGGKMSGFRKRKQKGIGHFIERSDLEEVSNSRLSQAFRGIPGLRITECGRGAVVGCRKLRSTRSRPSLEAQNRSCEPAYYVDGRHSSLASLPQGINSMSPQEIEAVEVYTGPSQMPPQFRGTRHRCGVVVLWTRAPQIGGGPGEE